MIRKFLDFVKFEHSIFALPFVYSGAVLAAGSINPEFILNFILITIAAVTARSSAMALNRIIDSNIDALNPRTKNRHIPAGKIGPLDAKIFTIISGSIFFLSAYLLNPLCFFLAPIPLVMFVIYPYLKRYTALTHLFLGACLGIAPLGGFLAITGNFDMNALIEPALISFFVMFWTAGFDIIYAIQDVKFDRSHNLHSIPAKFGVPNALKISFAFHLAAALFLIILYIIYPFSYIFLSGILIIILLLFYEHKLISNFDAVKIQKAFFNVNAVVSTLFFIFLAYEVLIM